MPDELIGHELPEAARHIWIWFLEISKRRKMGFNSPNPISYQDILAWATLTQAQPTPFDVDCIVALDAIWLTPKKE